MILEGTSVLGKGEPMASNGEPARQAAGLVEIIAAFASREAATVEDVLKLSRQLPGVLQGGSQVPSTTSHLEPAARADVVPAVTIAESVSEDAITCLCCGKNFVMLKRHLKAEHDLTEPEYRRLFKLSEDYPLVAPSYSERKASYAKQIGLGKYARDDV